jgi:glutathione synthase
MRVGFVVNDIETESENYTTTRLAMATVNRGHEAWFIGSSDMAFDPDDHVRARARTVTKASYKSNKLFLQDLRGPRGPTRAFRTNHGR